MPVVLLYRSKLQMPAKLPWAVGRATVPKSAATIAPGMTDGRGATMS
ncbi:hypothetical protein [Nocardioides sp.]|nr:hypothetical protein [Nocardioides sp.]